MPLVRMPDGTNVSFPDDMPKEQIKGMIAQKFPDAVPKIEPGNDGGALNAAVTGFNTAVPFGRKITSGLAAVGAKAADMVGIGEEGGNITLGELYNQAEADAEATANAHPVANIAGTVAGIANTLPLTSSRVIMGSKPTQGIRGAVNAIPEKLSQIGDYASRSFLTGRPGITAKLGDTVIQATKGSALAAPAGAVYGAGESDTGQEVEGAKSGAGVAAGLGLAFPVAKAATGAIGDSAKTIYKGFKARDAEQLEQAAAKIKQNGSQAYQLMRDNGAVFKPETTGRIVETLEKNLLNDGILNKGLHGKTLSVFDQFKEAAATKDLGLEELDQYRQLFGQVARNVTPDNAADARKASIVIEAIDDAVDAIGDDDLASGGREAIDALKLGRAEWAKGRKFEAITDIVRKSDGDANYLKRELKKFVDNPKKTRGFTQKELFDLKAAATLTTGEGIAKVLGKFGLDFGNSRTGVGVGSVLGASGGGAAFGPLGAVAAPIVGTGARYAQKLAARGKVDQLLKTIENRPITLNNLLEQPTNGVLTSRKVGDLIGR